MRVLVVLGGRSAEHDVSVASGWAVVCGLREAGHDVTSAHIDRSGRWSAIEVDGPMPADPEPSAWPTADPWGLLTRRGLTPDVVMPVLHGPRGEDGVIVALTQLADVACVGGGLTSSVACMDKTLTRDVLDARGIPQTAWLGVAPGSRVPSHAEAVRRLGSTVLFVKPANLGSSIGISRVTEQAQWAAALREASSYDDTLIVEAAVVGRELSVSILGNRADGYEVSEPSETRPHREFLDHVDKYGADAAMAQVPADLDPAVRKRVLELAPAVADALRVDVLARVDLFLTDAGDLLVNEVNTMPGFTAESTFPRMWAASGVGFAQLVDRLCRLAVRRHAQARIRTDAGSAPDPRPLVGPAGTVSSAPNSLGPESPTVGPVRIRAAEERDWQRIAELTVAAYASVPGRPPLSIYDQELADTAARARRFTLLVAEGADGRIVGAIGYSVLPETDGTVGRARQIAVDLEARGQGVGRALMDAVVARLRTEGASEMVGRTAGYMTGAQALYASLGFRRAPSWDEIQEVGPRLLGFHRHL